MTNQAPQFPNSVPLAEPAAAGTGSGPAGRRSGTDCSGSRRDIRRHTGLRCVYQSRRVPIVPRPPPLWQVSDAIAHMRQLLGASPDGSPLTAFLPKDGGVESRPVLWRDPNSAPCYLCPRPRFLWRLSTFHVGRLKPPREKQDDDDNQDDAEDADAAMTMAIAVAAEAATEPTEQRDDQDDDEDESKRRHGAVLPQMR